MKFRILLLLTLLFSVGCATNKMVVLEQQQLQRPSSDLAQVIFIRPSVYGGAISASLFDVTDGNIEFIGIIVPGVRIPYTTTPGKHVFMVVSEAADFMEADLSGGRNYYSITTPRMGLWKARFSLWPVKSDPAAQYNTSMPEFEEWSSSGKLVQNSEVTSAWYEQNKDSIKGKYLEYWAVWLNKEPAAIAERTLSPEDGE